MLNKMSCGHDYLGNIVRSDALVPCLTEVVLASRKEKATQVVGKVPVRVDDPLANEEGIDPNDRFRFADACPNVKFEVTFFLFFLIAVTFLIVLLTQGIPVSDSRC